MKVAVKLKVKKKPPLPTKADAVKALRNKLSTHLSQVSDLFGKWDKDRSGFIEEEEFRLAGRSLGLPGSEDKAFYNKVCDALFADYDTDGSGKLSYSEYIQQTLKFALRKSSQRVNNLLKLWDLDASGTISIEEWRRAIKTIGFNAPAAEVDALFHDIDEDGSGEIEYRELHNALRQGATIHLEEDIAETAAKHGGSPGSPGSPSKGGSPKGKRPGSPGSPGRRRAKSGDDWTPGAGPPKRRAPPGFKPPPGYSVPTHTPNASSNAKLLPASDMPPSGARIADAADAPLTDEQVLVEYLRSKGRENLLRAAGAPAAEFQVFHKPAPTPAPARAAPTPPGARRAPPPRPGAPGLRKPKPVRPGGPAYGTAGLLAGERMQDIDIRETSGGTVGNVLATTQKLDRSSSVSVQEQLRSMLVSNAVRVIDLFHQFDTDDSGEVSRAEFVNAMKTIGLDASAQEAGELFDSFDKDGGGTIEFRELNRILRHRAPPPPPTASSGQPTAEPRMVESSTQKSLMTTSSSVPQLGSRSGGGGAADSAAYDPYHPSAAWRNRSQTGIAPSMHGVMTAMETLSSAGALPRDCVKQLDRMRRVAELVAHKQGQHLQRTYSASAPLVPGSRATSGSFSLVAPPSRAPPQLRPKKDMRRTNSLDELSQLWLGPTRGEGVRRSDLVCTLRDRYSSTAQQLKRNY